MLGLMFSTVVVRAQTTVQAPGSRWPRGECADRPRSRGEIAQSLHGVLSAAGHRWRMRQLSSCLPSATRIVGPAVGNGIVLL